VQKNCRHRSIKALFIAPNFHTNLWRHALRQITPYVVPGMHVQQYEINAGTAIVAALPAIETASPLAGLSGGIGGTNALVLQQFILTQTDLQNALTIDTQVSPNAQKQQATQWTIMQDVQSKIFQIQQDATVNQARIVDCRFMAWDRYIRHAHHH
jgi:hypothetical protein